MPMYMTLEPSPIMHMMVTPDPYVSPGVADMYAMDAMYTPVPSAAPLVTPRSALGVQETPTPADPSLAEPLTVAVASPVPFLAAVSSNGTTNVNGNGTTPLNEGCVAVEHLTGYVLQHPAHLTRQVLCAQLGGTFFCATPNHAIIVDGVMTSMKLLCASTQCTRSVREVNNLRISSNRRAVVNQRVTITPYDMRFPKIAVWAVQLLQDALPALATATAAVATALAYKWHRGAKKYL